MAELTSLDKYLINSAMEAIVVLRCLNPDNLYKAECLLCQIWREFSAKKRGGIGKRFKQLVEGGYLDDLEVAGKDSDDATLYKIIP